jgi:Rps23 Pro-64 3,4-dihydroxylase Tpa1-like proline 4-hydroxylase
MESFKIIDNFLDEKAAENLYQYVTSLSEWNIIKSPKLEYNKVKKAFDEGEFSYFFSHIEDPEIMRKIIDLGKLNVKILEGIGADNYDITSIFLSKYEKGNFASLHDDNTEDKDIGFILYLSKEAKSYFGGILHFIDDEDNIIRSITPKFNRIVLFRVSDQSKHFVSEVVATDYKRIAVTGWVQKNTFTIKKKTTIF